MATGRARSLSSPGVSAERRGAPRGQSLLKAARTLISTSSLLSAARVAGAVAGFATQVVLARYLQASALGLFFSVASLAAVLSMVVSHGYPAIAPRFISRYVAQGREALIIAFAERARREAIVYVTIAVIGIAGFAWFWPGFDQVTRLTLIAGAFAIPATASLRVNGSMAMALRYFGIAYLPDTCIRPFLLLGGVLALIALGIPFDAAGAMWLLTGVLAILAFTQFVLVERKLPKVEAAPAPPRLVRMWGREAVPLIPVVLFLNFFGDVEILIVTPFLSPADVGAFGLSLKLALLVGFAVQVAQQVVVPDLADAQARKSFAHIHDVLLKALGFPLAITLGALLFILLWGEWALSLFGPEFTAAKWPLAVLLGSQLLRTLFGPNVGLLTVVGAQAQSAAIAVTALTVLVLGNLILAPLFGMMGAASAVMLAVLFWMIASAAVLYRLKGLRTDALALLLASRAPAKASEGETPPPAGAQIAKPRRGKRTVAKPDVVKAAGAKAGASKAGGAPRKTGRRAAPKPASKPSPGKPRASGSGGGRQESGGKRGGSGRGKRQG